MEPDTKTQLDTVLAELAAGEKTWADSTIAQRISLLKRTQETIAPEAAAWATTAAGIKLLDPDSPLLGEEWTAGPYATLAGLSALTETLSKIGSGKRPLDGIRLGHAPGNRITVPVLPANAHDRLMFSGYRAEVWLRPGVTDAGTCNGAGLGALDPTRTGGVGLVLGAGNITSIAPLDVFYELIAHNRVVVLKVNPILDLLTPVLERALAVAFGPGEEGRARKAAGPLSWTSRSPASSAAYLRSSSCPAGGARPTCGSRPRTWSPRGSTTAATTASPPRSWS
jgi:aldehyde dehydrogenase (NAD(P)+)